MNTHQSYSQSAFIGVHRQLDHFECFSAPASIEAAMPLPVAFVGGEEEQAILMIRPPADAPN